LSIQAIDAYFESESITRLI